MGECNYIAELERSVRAGRTDRALRFIGILWPNEPPVTTPEKIRMCVTPSGDVAIAHPERRPVLIRNGRIEDVILPPTDPFPLSAPEIREAKEHLFEGPDPTVDLADSMQKIAERYRLVPVVGPPYSKDLRYLQIKGEWIAPGDVKASAKPCASPEGLPSFLDIPRMPILERVEMLNRLNSILQDAPYVGPAPVGPSKIDIGIDYAGEPNKRPSPKFHIEIERGIGIGCHVCPGFNDHAPDFDALKVMRAAHDATVEHDRNMEKMLRNEIEEARVGVETARTALYDYLKSKNRAA